MPSGCNAVRVYAIKTSESRLLGLRGRKRERTRRGGKEKGKERRKSERVKGNRWPRER